MTNVHIRGNFDEVAEAYRNGGKVLERQIGAGLRKVAKPVGAAVIREGAARLPHRGGLAARVASGSKASLTSSGSSVTLRLQNRSGYQLAAMDRGEIRHPVFMRGGRGTAWVRQSIRPGAFREPFNDKLPMVQRELLDAAERAAAEIARDA